MGALASARVGFGAVVTQRSPGRPRAGRVEECEPMSDTSATKNPAHDAGRWLLAGAPRAHAATRSHRFTEVFGRTAQGVWFAPGRANLNGEHIDFHGGRCLPMAVRHGTYAAAAPRTDGLLRLRTLEP